MITVYKGIPVPECKPDEVVLRSYDNKDFTLKRELIMRYSKMVRNACYTHELTGLGSLEGNTSKTNFVPFHNVDGEITEKVLKYVEKHGEVETEEGDECSEKSEKSEDDLKAWDLEYLDVDLSMLCRILEAANYLEIQCLLDMACQAMADKLEGKTPDEICKTFNIKNDFTPEDLKEVESWHSWAFDE